MQLLFFSERQVRTFITLLTFDSFITQTNQKTSKSLIKRKPDYLTIYMILFWPLENIVLNAVGENSTVNLKPAKHKTTWMQNHYCLFILTYLTTNYTVIYEKLLLVQKIC